MHAYSYMLNSPEDPNKYEKPKDAWVAAIEEYNGFGAAKVSARFRIDQATSLQLFGFKVAPLNV